MHAVLDPAQEPTHGEKRRARGEVVAGKSLLFVMRGSLLEQGADDEQAAEGETQGAQNVAEQANPTQDGPP